MLNSSARAVAIIVIGLEEKQKEIDCEEKAADGGVRQEIEETHGETVKRPLQKIKNRKTNDRKFRTIL